MLPDLDETKIDRELARLATVCMAIAGSVGLYGLLIYLLVERSGEHGWQEAPGTGAFLLALGGLLLVVISSAARAAVLRRAVEGEDDGAETAGSEVGRGERLLAAFGRATLICFALAEGGALLGFASAWVGRVSFYGFLVCAAALYAMIVRWPRRSLVEGFLDEGREGER